MLAKKAATRSGLRNLHACIVYTASTQFFSAMRPDLHSCLRGRPEHHHHGDSGNRPSWKGGPGRIPEIRAAAKGRALWPGWFQCHRQIFHPRTTVSNCPCRQGRRHSCHQHSTVLSVRSRPSETGYGSSWRPDDRVWPVGAVPGPHIPYPPRINDHLSGTQGRHPAGRPGPGPGASPSDRRVMMAAAEAVRIAFARLLSPPAIIGRVSRQPV
jgi:hypothetical protein